MTERYMDDLDPPYDREPPYEPDPDRRCATCNWFEDGNFCGMHRQDVTADDGADCGLWTDPEDCDADPP